MAKTIEIMDALKKDSVQVYPGMIAVFPQFHKEEALNVDWAPKFSGCYATNNSTVCFVHEGIVYVTAYTRDATKSLIECGFREEYFYVPFSNCDYPKFEQEKWNQILGKANCYKIKIFKEHVTDYCDEHHIGALSEETLQNCFQIPACGVRVKKHNYQDIYYPVILSNYFDTTVADRLGKFCTNNGRVVFVYRDGNTYVTKGYKVLSELREAGYCEGGMFVPFSNCEEILDCELKRRWEEIKKN